MRSLLLCLSLSLFVAPLLAQDEDEPTFLPGLVATFAGDRGVTCQRVDERVAFAWRDRLPDLRLPQGPYSVVWRGRLFSIESGRYTLHAFAAGDVRISLNGQQILASKAKTPAWLAATPIELEYGYHPLEINFASDAAAPQIALFWEGPRFQLEPIPGRHLFHDPAAAPSPAFEQGRTLYRALRCAACHELPGEKDPLPAPALSRLHGNIKPAWLVDWLAAGGDHAAPADSANPLALAHRMPKLSLSKADAQAIAACLLAKSEATAKAPPANEPPPPPKAADEKKSKKEKEKAKATPPGFGPEGLLPAPKTALEAGEILFRTVGCLGCHQVGELGEQPLFGGGDLSRVATKRPADFFAAWLANPANSNPAHRMPAFALTNSEREQLSTYLASLGDKERSPEGAFKPNDDLIVRGQALLARHRCAACHAMPKSAVANAEPQPPRPLPFIGASRFENGCTGEAPADGKRPGYALTAAQTAAIKAYVVAANEPTASFAAYSRATDGELVLNERNCLGCHARGGASGLAGKMTKLLETAPELAPVLAALTPPALFDVGDKLHEAALAEAIAVKHPPRRPWLGVRMPKFDLDEAEVKAIVAHLVDADRIPDRPPVAVSEAATPTALSLAGARLVTADGFGCTSCHQIGNSLPQKVALNARGSDLSALSARIRRPWFDRWIRNPARIVPRMEMPSIVAPVKGVLHELLPDQLAAVWHVLDQKSFDPPLPNPVRVVRKSNEPSLNEKATLLTDVLESGKQVFAKPFLFALPNRHNLLFDGERNSLAAWTIGDAARQRTRGKAWYWELAGSPVVMRSADDESSELTLICDGKRMNSEFNGGQFRVTASSFTVADDGIRLNYGLVFSSLTDNGGFGRIVPVTQTIRPALKVPGSNGSGFQREYAIDLEPGESAELLLFPSASYEIDKELNAAWPKGDRSTRVVVSGEQAPRLELADGSPRIRLTPNENGVAKCSLLYVTTLPVDQYLTAAPVLPPPLPLQMDVVPGYSATKLPLTDAEMPVSLAWREDGTLVVCSLKGRVLLAKDTNGDGLEDELKPFSEELAAPYGAQPHDGALDVVTKHALLRLYDADRDGFAERSLVLASGWGHSPDYHDWAVGLPKDKDGNYYVALPCQQDDRSPGAAYLRGKGLLLKPRSGDTNKPQSYTIEEFCSGLRFPMGIAINRDGDLFTTDNQGNYNPFNELNHWRRGKHYGFINKLEFSPTFKPPLEPPAVNIPHPWMRSVNGLCFLETPPDLREKLHRDQFGPFEGHLIGCEYDNRQLVRMSLEKVNGEFQGAVYPFTLPPLDDSQGFLGPISCAVSPAGDLYVGNIKDSGWGGGANVGYIVTMRPEGELPAGIAEVRCTPTGFTLDFTQSVDAKLAGDIKNYNLSSYRRISTPEYGGPDVDRRTEKIARLELSPDRRRATVTLLELRPGFVYEFRVANLAGADRLFHPAEAHYTLRSVPK